MKVLSVLLFSMLIVLGGCNQEQAGTDEQKNQDEVKNEERKEKEDHQYQESKPDGSPDVAMLEADLRDKLIQETNENDNVERFDTKDALSVYLEDILVKSLADTYVERFYKENGQGLFLQQKESLVWLDTNESYQTENLSERKYKIVQSSENELLGEYELTITYIYDNETWKIQERNLQSEKDEKSQDNNVARKDDSEESNDKKETEQNDRNKETEKKKPVEKKNDNKDSNQKEDPQQEKQQQPTEQSPKVVDDPDDLLVVVNKKYHLPEGYVPHDLIEAPVPFPFKEDLPKKQMRAEAAAALDKMFQDANSQGLNLYAQSGYRSYERQEAIFAANVERYGSKEKANRVSAEPGESEHQTGLAMDVTSPAVDYRLVQSFSQTKEGQWVEKHASDYGFIIRYPRGKSSITGYDFEPWHLRYVGKEAAKYIDSQNITLEEYLGVQ
ncbi:D-alanyl-D-alanine carboxypeptidase family protein [Pseudalkalibacillus sp. SCS-8]|uniref:M15 family metallopeptidase n=1 Tax=Pseudalkalibacillus nanhaiensis TaxID=3115291 RepID=UPI0032DB042B